MFGINPKRKKKYVSGPIQGRLMIRIGLYWVLYHFVLWQAIFVFRYFEFRVESTTMNVHVPFSEMYSQFVLDSYPILFCALVALPIVVVDMMNLTHRIAGPLVRFQRSLRALSEGKQVRKIALRKGDLLIEFQEEFNRYLETIAQQQDGQGSRDEGISANEEQVLVEVDQLRKTVQDALVDAAGTRSISTDSDDGVPDAKPACEEDTVISSTFPLS